MNEKEYQEVVRLEKLKTLVTHSDIKEEIQKEIDCIKNGGGL